MKKNIQFILQKMLTNKKTVINTVEATNEDKSRLIAEMIKGNVQLRTLVQTNNGLYIVTD